MRILSPIDEPPVLKLVDRIVCFFGLEMNSELGCDFGQLTDWNGPPAGADAGQLWVNTVTAPAAGAVPVWLRYASKKAAPWSFRNISWFGLFAPRPWPRLPSWSDTGPLRPLSVAR